MKCSIEGISGWTCRCGKAWYWFVGECNICKDRSPYTVGVSRTIGSSGDGAYQVRGYTEPVSGAIVLLEEE